MALSEMTLTLTYFPHLHVMSPTERADQGAAREEHQQHMCCLHGMLLWEEKTKVRRVKMLHAPLHM